MPDAYQVVHFEGVWWAFWKSSNTNITQIHKSIMLKWTLYSCLSRCY